MEFVSGNLFIRDMGSFATPHEKGWKMEGHAHNFHHNTLILSGRYRCRRWSPVTLGDGTTAIDVSTGEPLWVLVDDVERGAGTILPIEAHMRHDFEALEDGGRILCLYSHRDPQSGEVVQLPNGWRAAYV